MDLYNTPIALPYWPTELEQQWHRWTAQEPWWSQLDALRYLRAPSWGEPRPGLPAGSWGRFFIWRWCAGYGTKAFACAAWRGAGETELRLREVQRGLGQGTLAVEDLDPLFVWTLVPFYAAVHPRAWGPRELLHKNTVRKLERLRLLDAAPAVGRA